ncbi:MAG: hypothetical protein ABR508_01315 [Candidatus Baltobacteraceae bacterium]
MPDAENLPLSDELLQTMRLAAKIAIELGEPFITPRVLLLALLEEPSLGPAIGRVIFKQKLLAADVENNFGSLRAIDEFLPGETAAMTRYNTLAFKTPDGRTSMWLSREALNVFVEGAKRVNGRYDPRELALGIAADAVHSPGILAAIRVQPGVLGDAVP